MPSVKSAFFGNSPRFYAAKNPRSLGFEEAPEGFDNGRFPSCAINGKDQFIEVHMGESASFWQLLRDPERLTLRRRRITP